MRDQQQLCVALLLFCVALVNTISDPSGSPSCGQKELVLLCLLFWIKDGSFSSDIIKAEPNVRSVA